MQVRTRDGLAIVLQHVDKMLENEIIGPYKWAGFTWFCAEQKQDTELLWNQEIELKQ